MLFNRTSGARILGALTVLLATGLVSKGPSSTRPLSGMSRHRHNPAIIRERHGNNATSTNWSGYVVTGANNSVTDVKGSWTVPTLVCPALAPDSYSSFWLGIDGYGSNTVEQIGIEADCVGGTPVYSAWFEFYPHWPYSIDSVPVHPGDTMSAEVSYGAKGQFTVKLTNVHLKQSFSTTTKMPQAQLSSAEWIAEAPWSSGVLPLANFGTAFFDTCSATVGKNTNAIGKFSAANVIQVDMVTSGGVVKAQTSKLSGNGSSFSVVWIPAGT